MDADGKRSVFPLPAHRAGPVGVWSGNGPAETAPLLPEELARVIQRRVIGNHGAALATRLRRPHGGVDACLELDRGVDLRTDQDGTA